MSDYDVAQGMQRLNVSKRGGRRDLHAYAQLGNEFSASDFDPNAAASSAGIAPPGQTLGYISQQGSQQSLQQQYPKTPTMDHSPAVPSPGYQGGYQPNIGYRNGSHNGSHSRSNSQYQPDLQYLKTHSRQYSGQYTPGQQGGVNAPQFQEQKRQQQLLPAEASFQQDVSLSVPSARETNDQTYRSSPFLTFENVSPPLAGTQYLVNDQGNASPKFARISLYSVPASKELLDSTGFPLGLMLRPFAPAGLTPEAGDKDHENLEEVPEADFSNSDNVPRCRRCRAYVNPAMQHTGYQMVCNLCGFTSPVPTEYTSTVDTRGLRSDFYQRPELHSGVYDLKVPKDYWPDETPPQPLHHVFLIDLTQSARKSQLVAAASTAIQLSLYDHGQSVLPKGSKVAIVGFDSALRFFDLSPSHHQAGMAVVTDLYEPFVPFHEGIFADPVEAYDIIESTLTTIEQGDVQAAPPEPAFGAALLGCKLLLESVGGGQVTSFISTVPSVNPGALRSKIPRQGASMDFALFVLSSGNKFYDQLAKDMVASNVGVNVFVGTSVPTDLMNMAAFAGKTGGTAKLFPRFSAEKHELDLAYAVKESIQSAAGYQGQLKIRCSGGLQIAHYYTGMQVLPGDSAPTFAVLGPDTTVSCDFVYDGKLNTKKDAHFQAALLYTGTDGCRRVRVINSIMSVTERVSDVFSFADQDAVLNFMLRQKLANIPERSVVEVRNMFVETIVDIVSKYKKFVAKNNTAPGQFVLPTGIRTLPMMLLGALKVAALSGKNTPPDLRVYSYEQLITLPAARLSVVLYPILICLHRLQPDDCKWTEGHFEMPQTLPLQQAQLEAGGAYLLYNGDRMFLWLHTDIAPQFIEDLLGASSLDQLDPLTTTQLPQIDTQLSEQVRALCAFLPQHYQGRAAHSIELCRFQKDACEIDFLELFYEDKSSELVWSYADFLRYLHKQIESSPAAGSQDNSTLAQRFSIF